MATTLYLSCRMKQPKISFLIVVGLLLLTSVSCIGETQPMGGWSGPTVQNGIVYVGSRDGSVVAINASTQELQWQWPSDTKTIRSLIYTTPIVHGNLVYIGTYSGKIYALSVAESADIWVRPTEGYIGAIVANPVIANGTIYVTSSDGMVYALDITRSGVQKWKSDRLADKLWTSPAIAGDVVYVSTYNGCIYALSTGTGELLNWSFKSQAGFASSPVISEDTIFVGSFDRYLYAVKIGGDEPLWKFPQDKPAGNWFWASPVVSEGIVYAACLDGKLYAIEAKTGKKLWEFQAEAPIVSSPILVGNLLVIASEAGNVYVVNPGTGNGERIKNPQNDNKPTIDARIRAPLCAQESLVYIRAEDNHLYAVDIGEREVSWKVSLATRER